MTAATRSSRATWGAPPLLLAEIGLCSVTVAIAASTTRLFQRTDYLATLLALVVAAHVAAALLRRVGVPMLTATIVLLAVGALVLAWVHYPHTLWWGSPTMHTVRDAGRDLRAAFAPFRAMTTPAPMTKGFEVALAGAMWVMAVFADGATFSADAPVQALIPPFAAFVFISILDRANHFLVTAVLVTLSVALFALCVRALRQTRLTWARDEAPRAARFNVSAGLLIAILAVGIGAAVVPWLPGTGDKGVVDLRKLGSAAAPRQVDSPLVGLQSLLTNQSDEIMFTVEAPAAHYWRQTSLNDFSGTGWGSTAVYREIDSGDRLLPSDATDAPDETDRFHIDKLRDIWMPAAFDPARVRTDLALRYDPSSSTLILDDSRVSHTRDSYTVHSQIPALDRSQLHDSTAASARGNSKDLELPTSFSGSVTRLARALTADAADDYDRAMALQDYFRSGEFAYDRSVDYRASSDPLVSFLNAKRGFCQQFATAFAAMARSLGIPARVAVGFTYGDPDNAAHPTRWTVRGRNAHAWPELHIAGVGWVAFEPTPGRGNPDATGYSGLAASQTDPAADPPSTSPTTVPATPTTSPAPAISIPAPTTSAAAANPPPTTTRAADSGASFALLTGAGSAVAIIGLVLLRMVWVRRRHERRRAADRAGESRVRDMWADTCRDLQRVDLRPAVAETPIEFASRAADELGVDAMCDLGSIESARCYAADIVGDEAARRAIEIHLGVHEVVWSRLPVVSKIRSALDL